MSITWQFTGGQALGDSWNLVSWLLQRDENPVEIWSNFSGRDRSHADMAVFVKRIEALMDAPRAIQIVDKPGQIITVPQRGHGALWDPARLSYTPTKKRWDRRSKGCKRLCHQFDGRSAAPHNVPTYRHIQEITSYFRHYEWIRLGLPMTIEDIVTQLATCDAFIGADSGVSHIAHSVGCPMVVWSTSDHAHTRSMHPAGDWRHATTLDDAIANLQGVMV